MENRIKVLGIVLKVLCLLACLGLVVMGQKNIGYPGLLAMLVGLTGILILLYMYNNKYKDPKEKRVSKRRKSSLNK